jgi:hypothetical protein
MKLMNPRRLWDQILFTHLALFSVGIIQSTCISLSTPRADPSVRCRFLGMTRELTRQPTGSTFSL